MARRLQVTLLVGNLSLDLRSDHSSRWGLDLDTRALSRDLLRPAQELGRSGVGLGFPGQADSYEGPRSGDAGGRNGRSLEAGGGANAPRVSQAGRAFGPHPDLAFPDSGMVKVLDDFEQQGASPYAPDGQPGGLAGLIQALISFLSALLGMLGLGQGVPGGSAPGEMLAGRQGDPYAKDIKQAFPELSLDRRSPDYVDQLKKVIDGDMRAAYGRPATEQDFNYWIPKFMGENDSSLVTSGQMSADTYWHQRLLGMGAGGADVALYGPFAGGAG